MLKIASKPVDVQDLHFKLQCRLNVFDKQKGSLSKTSKSLLASASRYGLVFAGCASAKLKVLGFESIESISSTKASKEYPRREINLISEPHHISVNCDHTILAVIVPKDNCLSALFYDVLSFYKENVVLLNEVRLTSTPNLEVLQANWHPTLNNIFTECKSDGTLGIYELKDKSIDVKKLPAESKACCFCWSPKGKQIAVGSQNGKIIHYKPDLKAVKSIDAPPFDKPHSILSLQWISNYQFIGVFKTSNESEPECSVVLIDAPKTGNPTFTNYYDICYSNGNFRPPQFYMIAEQHWNILLVASANSMEVGVLSNTGEIWTQWILPDSARAELPLDENQDETFPIGMTIDTSSDKPVLWGESYLQPSPSLLLLSHEGILCCFKMVNLKEGAPSVNSPAEKVADMSGLRHFVTPAPEPVSIPQEVPNLQQATKNATSSNVATPAQTNPPSMFSLPSSTPTSAPTLQPSSQGQQTPTTPLSIFKSPAPLQKLPSLPTNLFGSQISITPVKSKEVAPPTSAASVGASLLTNILSEGSSAQKKEVTSASMPFSNLLSSSVAAQTTIIPVGKQSGTTSGVLAGSGTGNRLSGSGQLQAGGLQGTSFTASSTPGSGPMQASKNPASGGAAPQNVQFGLQRTETKPNVPSSVPNTTKPPALVKIDKSAEERENAEIKNMLTKMIQMECLALEKEIKDLIIQGQHLKIPLKYDEMGQIVQNTDDINEFLKELVETCEIQSSEVHILKQNTIQSWAWVEEARSRYKESQDQELNSLLKSKPLDSVSEKHLSTLKQMKYYLDSQLKQSHKALDDQWEKFQDYCRKNNRIQLPTMEAIFQTMVKQNAILQKHNYILKDISSQLKGKQKASNNAALFNPLDKKDSLDVSFQNLKLEPENIYNIYYQKVLNRVKSVPPNKTNQLRRILHNREVPHVMAKSQLSTSSLNSSLRTSQLSTSLKTPIGKKDSSQLYQSTPLNLTPESAPQIASTPLSAFAATSNLASKPQLPTRFGSESQYTVPSSMPTASPLSGDKQSGVPQSQNSLFKTSTVNTNEKVGYNAFSNFGFGQEANQNRNNATSSSLSNSFSTSTNLQSQKFTVAQPAVATSKQFVPVNPNVQTSNVITSTAPQNVKSTNVFGPAISSSAGSSQSGASNKLFSFVSSTGQPKELPGSTAVTSTTAGFSASIGSTMPSVGAAAPSNTFASSFLNSASNGVSGFGKTTFGGTAGLFASSSSIAFGSDPSSNKVTSSAQGSLPEKSVQATSGFTFGSPATSDAAVSSSGVSEIAPSETNNEAVPSTATSIFKFSTTTSSKPSFASNLVSGSGSKPAATIFSVPTSDTVSTTSSSGTSSTSGGVNSASSTFQFGTSVTSSDSVSTTTSSIFSLSLKKEESSVDNKPTVSSTGEVSSSTAVTSTEASSGKSIFGANPTSSGTQSLGTFAFGNSASVSSTAPGEVSITSKSIFNIVSTTSPSLFGVSSTTGDSSSSTSKSVFSNSATSTVPGSTNNALSVTSKSIFGTSVSSSGTATETPDSKTDTVPTSTTSTINNASSSNAGIISSSVPSIFGATSSGSQVVGTKSIFGASAKSSATVPSSPSIFGTPAAGSGTAPSPSIFGASAASSGTTPSTSQSIFGASTTSSISSTSASKSIFGTSATSSGTVSSASPSIFGVSATSSGATPSASKSIFGASATSGVSASSSSIFGAATTTGGAAPLAAKSIFGVSTTSSGTASTSIFGASGTSSGTASPASTSIFGASAASSGTAPSASTSIFGASATSSGTASTSSIFGATATAGPLSLTKTSTPTATSQPSPFGNASSTGSIFGNAATTGSPFGTGKSVFGSANPAASPFGSSAPVSSSPFSATPFANATSSNSVFGQVTSTVSPFNTAAGATSPFSGTAANAQTPFGATPSTAESPFGAVTPSVCSPFGSQGFGTGFNSNTTVQSSPFGQVSTSSNVFGSSNPTSASTFGTVSSSENASSPFGQSSGGMFGSFGSNSTKPAEGSFGFGDLNMGTASQSVFSKPNENKSPFGSTNFNPTTSSGSLFGNSSFGNNNGNSVFRQSSFGGNSVFSSTQQSGPFSGGSGSIAQSGFGIQTPQKPPAFGASPTFGGTPAFGSAPTFGGAPAFGSTPTFGSPNQVFGSASPAQAGSAFGSTNTQQSSGFGSFASQNSLGFGNLGQQQNNPAANSSGGSGFGSFSSQNTIGFGNLAQQTNNAQNAPFSGTSSFSSWR